jgi:hypothetical protein
MNASVASKNQVKPQGRSITLFNNFHIRRGLAFGVIIIAALLAFEMFNYSTTDFALTDLLGDLSFVGIRWATILAIAFCGIDFAGIARLFTPEEGADEPREIWYLFGAWMLAAIMNAMLTWWGVSLAILNHNTLGNAVIDRETLLRIVPIFVAVLVWLIRVLIIGTFSVAGDRLFSQAERRPYKNTRSNMRIAPSARQVRSLNSWTKSPSSTARSASSRKSSTMQNEADNGYTTTEHTYHPVMSAKSNRRSGHYVNKYRVDNGKRH